MSDERESQSEGVRITDRRLIDPDTFQLRQPATPAAAPEGDAEPAQPADDAEQAALAEATARAEEAVADAKRIAAEFLNYKKRVERDREVHRDAAIGSVLVELLPVLDDIGRARLHDELTGGFKSVAEAVEAVGRKFGVETLGEVGEPFDPAVHEAMTSEQSDEVAGPTVKAVYQVGYRLRGRLLRPARVGVADNG